MRVQTWHFASSPANGKMQEVRPLGFDGGGEGIRNSYENAKENVNGLRRTKKIVTGSGMPCRFQIPESCGCWVCWVDALG